MVNTHPLVEKTRTARAPFAAGRTLLDVIGLEQDLEQFAVNASTY